MLIRSVVAVLIVSMASGCIFANRFVSERADPRQGEQLKLYFKTLKVVQVCDDCVHVVHESYDGLRIAVIPLINDYVTGSYLRTGLYEYVGPYTYVTIKDKNGNQNTNTVRLFREIKQEE